VGVLSREERLLVALVEHAALFLPSASTAASPPWTFQRQMPSSLSFFLSFFVLCELRALLLRPPPPLSSELLLSLFHAVWGGGGARRAHPTPPPWRIYIAEKEKAPVEASGLSVGWSQLSCR
jgi:hypothetical protein